MESFAQRTAEVNSIRKLVEHIDYLQTCILLLQMLGFNSVLNHWVSARLLFSS